MNREELNHLEDEEWDMNRAKRERLEECRLDARPVHTNTLRNRLDQYDGDWEDIKAISDFFCCASYAQARRIKSTKELLSCGSKPRHLSPKSGTDQST